MPVLQQIPINSYLASGSGTVFPYTFKLPNEESLKVFIDEVLQPSGYVISNVGNNAGGNVTFTVPPPADAVIRLERNIALERNTDYIEGGDLAAAVLDSDFDTLIMMVQELDATTLRAQGGSGTDAFGRRITNVGEPVDGSDAATKGWVESSESSVVAQALVHANAAEASADAAAASALNASESEDVTAADVVAATAAKDLAEDYADAAAASETAAGISETNAAASAAAALASENAADASETAAAGSASAASGSAVAANISQGAASASAVAAAGSAASAATSYSNLVTTIANFPGRNKIINGKMEILQRGATFTSPVSATYTLDRWVWGNTSACAVTITHQNADSPSSEFRSSLRVAVTTADASIAAGDLAYIGQRIEGYNVRDLIGKDFTISFWVRSSEVGTHAIALRNNSSDRSHIKTYTVSVANTWEYKTVTVTGGLITAGGWDWTNGVGLYADWVLAVGTTYHTTANAWQTGSFLGVSGLVNCLDTIGNIFAITGVQIEVGTVATPFEHRHHQQELALCQRYYCTFNAVAGAAYSTAASSAGAQAPFYYPVTMRATPTVTAGSATLTNATDAFFGIDASSGYYVVTQGAGAGNYNGRRTGCQATAEL